MQNVSTKSLNIYHNPQSLNLNDQIVFRAFTVADHKGCTQAFETNVPKYFTAKESQDYGPWLTARIQEKGMHYYVGLIDNKVVACGGFAYQEKENELRLVWGFVDRSRHKKGIGKMLLQFRLTKMEKLYPQVLLRLDTTQFSFGFFEKMGFVTDKITKDFYAPGYDRYDMTYLPFPK